MGLPPDAGASTAAGQLFPDLFAFGLSPGKYRSVCLLGAVPSDSSKSRARDDVSVGTTFFSSINSFLWLWVVSRGFVTSRPPSFLFLWWPVSGPFHHQSPQYGAIRPWDYKCSQRTKFLYNYNFPLCPSVYGACPWEGSCTDHHSSFCLPCQRH